VVSFPGGDVKQERCAVRVGKSGNLHVWRCVIGRRGGAGPYARWCNKR